MTNAFKKNEKAILDALAEFRMSNPVGAELVVTALIEMNAELYSAHCVLDGEGVPRTSAGRVDSLGARVLEVFALARRGFWERPAFLEGWRKRREAEGSPPKPQPSAAALAAVPAEEAL